MNIQNDGSIVLSRTYSVNSASARCRNSVDAISEHVETCPSCASDLGGFDSDEDELIGMLRGSEAKQRTHKPEIATTDAKTTANGLSPATAGIIPSRSTEPDARYRDRRPHARGGIGQILIAQDAELNREVAFKTLQDHHADNSLADHVF